MQKSRGFFIRLGLGVVLSTLAFYTLHGDDSVPDFVFESLHLLSKPIEDLLPDLKTEDEEKTTADAVEKATLDLDDYEDLKGGRERWNEMRQIIESGEPIVTPLPSEIAESTSPVGHLAPAIPPEPGFTVKLPYESRLTVSGRKTIGMTFRNTQFTNASFATSQGIPTAQSTFDLEQQLQVRINGQIGRKVTVNVDFDDTKTDKQDISIVYKGDPDEIVQRAAFGDINLSLPQTEFAGYSKQVFGASAELKYKALHEYVVGSRTKGQTETKEFVGNVILQRLTIPDTAYVRHKYYNYTKMIGAAGDRGIDINTMKVWVDTKDITRSSASLTTLTVDPSLLPGATAYTGSFTQFASGSDYTVDPSSGVITFRNPLVSNAVVAIDYNPAGQSLPISQTRGIPGQLKILKFDESQILQIPVTEELTHYTLGVTKIVRDNGQGNFILQLRDLGNNPIGQNVGIQYLPNNVGQIIMDFENGVFVLTQHLPSPTYDPVYQPTPTTLSNFFVEFRSRVKTYTLRPNIVINSEHITMDGRTLTRDVDYFIDYESGFITFFNEDQITDTTHIQATYDYSPFGIAGAQQDTLVGERTELSLYPVAPILGQSLLGTTVLYDFAPKETAPPDIRQTTGSFLVTEADLNFKDLIFNPIPLLKSSFAGEVARSSRNPNTFGKALIDNMEGIADETSINLNAQSWQLSSNPTSTGTVTYANAIGIQHTPAYGSCLGPHPTGSDASCDNLVNERIRTLDINPNASALSGDQTQVLDINYDLSRSPEASIATVLSNAGLDFSKKLYVEMWVQGDGTQATGAPSGTQFNITIGQINEDADGTNGGGFTDIYGSHPQGDGTPRTEDLNRNNTLDNGEDIGWTFHNPDGTTVQLGAGNLHLDSEDLDRNGILDAGTPPAVIEGGSGIGGNIGYASEDPMNNNIPFGGSGPNTVDYSGWKFVRVPLDISSDTATNWTAIKELRVSVRPSGTLGAAGTIKIAKISVVGNRWQADPPIVAGSTITVNAINTEDDANYVSPAGNPDFDALNQVNTALSGPTPNRRKEQALAIDYSFLNGIQGSSVTTVSRTNSAMDFTAYGSVRFFLYGDGNNGNGESFFFRAGTDTDYWEYRIVVNWTGWREITIKQFSATDSQRPDSWADGAGNPGPGTITKVGLPNLTNVAQLRAGVLDNSNGTNAGELWLDEIHAADVITRVGYATRGAADFELFGWGKFGTNFKSIDRNFETFTSAITDQDRKEQNAYLDITRIPIFPMSFKGSHVHTITPVLNTVNSSTLISVQQQGDVDDKSFSGTGALQIPLWPKIGLLYDTDRLNTADLDRVDKTDHMGTTFDYTTPGTHLFIPKTISLGVKLTKLDIDFGPDALTDATDSFSVSDTKDRTYDWTAKMSFQPLPGFTFNPNYSLSETHEYKDAIQSTSTPTSLVAIDYDKDKTQTVGLDGVMAFKRWFSPRLRYTMTDRETYGIPLSVDPTAAEFKSVDRTGTGELAWDFAWRDFSKNIRPLQSLNIVTSYLMEDGDSWQNVASGYNTFSLLSVRQSLDPGNAEAARENLTIRDTIRSTQRWNPFDWTGWTGTAQPLRTLSLTSTITDTRQRQETTGTPSKILTTILPDLVLTLSQTEYFFHAQNYMSNSQMNLKSQYKTVNTIDTSLEKASTNGGDWRFTMWRKLDFFFSYTRTTDNTFDEVNNVEANQSVGDQLSAQLAFNIGKWRITPKYDQSSQKSTDSSGILTTDLTKRTPAVQVYADLFLPAGLKLPFSDLLIFSNRIRTTNTLSLTQSRSSLNAVRDNTDTYTLTTSEDYELTQNVRVTVGGSYSYNADKVTSDANFFSYEFDSLLTIQF